MSTAESDAPDAADAGADSARGSRPRTLNRAEIAAVALRQIDERGVADFSLRDVARTLGVYPTALYWYVPSRRDLLGEVVSLALGDVIPPLPRSDRSWQEWLTQLFRRYRNAVRAHPRIAPLLSGQLSSNAGISLAIAEATLATLERAGFAGAGLRNAYNTVVGGLVGWVGLEFAPAPTDDGVDAIRERIEQLSADEHPTLHRHLGELRNRAFSLRWKSGSDAPLDEAFTAFVATLIAGLESRLDRR